MMGYYTGYGFGPMHFLGGIIEFLFWAIIIVVVFRLIRGKKTGVHYFLGQKSSLDLLEERYVKGEISRQEFEEKKKDLQS